MSQYLESLDPDSMENQVQALLSRLTALEQRTLEVNTLDEISNSSGVQIEGEHRWGNGLEPGSGFTGLRAGYPGFDYSSSTWLLAAVLADSLRVGFDTDGRIRTAGNGVILDEDGIDAIKGLIGGFTLGEDTITGGALTLDASGVIQVGTGNDLVVLSAADALYRLWAGSASASTAPFYVTAAGLIHAEQGDVGRWNIDDPTLASTNLGIVLDALNELITVGAASPRLVLDGVNCLFGTDTFTSGFRGFRLNGKTGNAEINDLVARGEFRAALMAIGEMQVNAGTNVTVKSGGKLYEGFTSQAGSNTIKIEDAISMPGAYLFSVGDILRIKTWISSAIVDDWFTVTGRSLGAGYQTYTCTRNSGSNATFSKATPVADYGKEGDGGISISADGSLGSSPNITLFKVPADPWNGLDAFSRWGRLDGYSGINGENVLGMVIGDADAQLSYAIGSALKLSGAEELIQLIGLVRGLTQTATNGTATRVGSIEAFLPTGSTTPAFGISHSNPAEGTELVINGTFESALTSGWTVTGTNPWARTTAKKYDGSYSIFISGEGYSTITSANITFGAQQQGTISYRAYSETETEEDFLYIGPIVKYYSSTGTLIKTEQLLNLTSGPIWSLRIRTFTTPASCSYITISFSAQYFGEYDSLYIDSVSCTANAEPKRVYLHDRNFRVDADNLKIDKYGLSLPTTITATYYVDGTNGSDGENYGTGSGTSAWKTITYALAHIPKVASGNIVINLVGYFTESVNIRGFMLPPGCALYFNGSMASYTARTVGSGSTQTNGATRATIVATASLENAPGFVVYGSDTRVFESSNGAIGYVVGEWTTTPVAGNSFTLVRPAYEISGNITIHETRVIFNNLNLKSASITIENSSVGWGTCVISRTGIVSLTAKHSILTFDRCQLANNAGVVYMDTRECDVTFLRCLIFSAYTGYAMMFPSASSYNFSYQNIITGYNQSRSNIGIYSRFGSYVSIYHPAATGYMFIKMLAVGIQSLYNGSVLGTANIQFDAVTTQKATSTASFGYCD